MTRKEKENTLSSVFYSVKHGYKNADDLLKQARSKMQQITKQDVEEWLEKQPTYTMHKPARKKFSRNRVLVSSIDEQWQADLVDLQSLKKYNDNFKYLLTCIDVFSKFGWSIPLISKSSGYIIDAFKKIFESGRKPYKLQTDAGTEFTNKNVQQFLKANDIYFFVTKSEMKASVVERFNRTLKERMWKVFTHKNTFRYLDFLDALLENYNNSYHRTIKTCPIKVTTKNEREILNRVFRLNSTANISFKFNIGDKVRISKMKRHFEKGYWPNWTEEYFIIDKRFSRQPPVYILKDQMNEIIDGVFYEPELEKIDIDASDIFVIEKVLKVRKCKNKIEYLVKWRGYPEKFNSWVSDLIKL